MAQVNLARLWPREAAAKICKTASSYLVIGALLSYSGLADSETEPAFVLKKAKVPLLLLLLGADVPYAAAVVSLKCPAR